MNTPPVRLERRPMQRFALTLPVSVRLTSSGQSSAGFTQDLSARGVFFYTDLALAKDDAVELTFVMPSEITLAETMRVRCRGKVVRSVASSERGMSHGVAVRLEGYDFLPETEPRVPRSRTISQVPAAVHSTSDQPPAPPASGVSSVTLR